MARPTPLKIQLLCVPDCPLVTKAQTTLNNALEKAPHIPTKVEQLVGDYSSPTILVEGYDVTGQPQQQKDRPACRLDLPTEEQILGALERFGAMTAVQGGKPL